MTLETALTSLLYIVAGWIALLGVGSLHVWRQRRRRDDLWMGLVDVLAATVAIAYLVWWPLVLALTWHWVVSLRYRDQTNPRSDTK